MATLLAPEGFTWANEEFDDGSGTCDTMVGTLGEVQVGQKLVGTAAAAVSWQTHKRTHKPTKMNQFIVAMDCCGAGEVFSGEKGGEGQAKRTAGEAAKKPQGCCETSWCPTRDYLFETGIFQDDGFKLFDGIEYMDIAGAHQMCPERLLSLYNPKAFKELNIYVGFY